MTRNPLGRQTPYPRTYAPDVLFPVARAEARAAAGIEPPLPFSGEDLWNAWELTWLDADGRPRVAAATIRVDAASTCIVESKSLKLYLNSFAMTRHDDAASLSATIAGDLERAADGRVTVEVAGRDDTPPIRALPGLSIDTAPAAFDADAVAPQRLSADPGNVVEETLTSDLLRSNCPITGQPDLGSLLVRYSGPRIDRAGLLDYVVSYRNHGAFHEACIERMFVDLQDRCGTDRLTVYARYCRRGGIDINPFRSDFESAPDNLRTWRQ